MAMHVVVPPLGWAQDIVLEKWLKEDGDWVNPGTPLCIMQSAGSRRTLLALDGGVLRLVSQEHSDGTRVRRGQPLASIQRPGEDFDRGYKPPPPLPPRLGVEGAIDKRRWLKLAMAAHPDRPRVSPRARRLAREANIALERIRGTGYQRRIVARDIESVRGARADTSSAATTLDPPTLISNVPFASATYCVTESTSNKRQVFPQVLECILQALQSLMSSHDNFSWAYACWSRDGWQFARGPHLQSSWDLDLVRRHAALKTPPANSQLVVYDLTEQNIDFFLPAIAPGGRMAAAIGVTVVPATGDRQMFRMGYRLTLVADPRQENGVQIMQYLQAIGETIASRSF